MSGMFSASKAKKKVKEVKGDEKLKESASDVNGIDAKKSTMTGGAKEGTLTAFYSSGGTSMASNVLISHASSPSRDVLAFKEFHRLMKGGVKILKLSSNGVWQKKILTLSSECLTVQSRGKTVKKPVALVWVVDINKPLDAMDKAGKPIRTAKWADKPRHGHGGVFFEDIIGVNFGPSTAEIGKSPSGKAKSWEQKYDMESQLTVTTVNSEGRRSGFVFSFRRGEREKRSEERLNSFAASF